MHAHAIAQVEPPIKGIHLIWVGPYPWVYSPQGWSIQRRIYRPKEEIINCGWIDAIDIERMRSEREMRLSLGTVIMHEGAWPTQVDIASISSSSPVGNSADVFTLELDEPQSSITLEIDAYASFGFALHDGKVVASNNDSLPGTAIYDLYATSIDTVVVYALSPKKLNFCTLLDTWDNEPYIVDQLQLPLKELNPSLIDSNDEYAEGKKRLLEGESLDEAEFKAIADILRVWLGQAVSPRPIDQLLLLREDTNANFEELSVLDPIRALILHPKWRRVLGFGWFDRDPALQENTAYEYRITGYFPASDLADSVYGFHTVPSQTALPAEFYLRDLRLRLPQPTVVERSPEAFGSSKIQISRRGIRIHPLNQDFGLLPSTGGWSLVIEFPSPVGSIILDMHEDHSLEYSWGMPWGTFTNPDPVPPGPRPRLNFSDPITQLRLRGDGFLYAIHIPAMGVPEGIVPLSVVLPPVTLTNTPRPDPPIMAYISNLQKPQPVATDDIPPETVPPRHALGFNITWRPKPESISYFWPSDEGAPPFLGSYFYQIEHRQEPSTIWKPLLPEENWVSGSRDEANRDTDVQFGIDLMSLFPEVSTPSKARGLDLHWEDVFDFEEGGNQVLRPVPPPGTTHQYRLRAVDPVGRPSLTWQLTNILRLEKHLPPPIPVGPDDAPASDPLPAPRGVQARVLVKDAPDLTNDDKTILENYDNVIILRWGWHKQQRDQDPLATEFRVYIAEKPLDSVEGMITDVKEIGLETYDLPRGKTTGIIMMPHGIYDVTIKLDRAVASDAAKNSSLQAGYPFYIRTHTGGNNITARLEARIHGPDGSPPKPILGPVEFPLHLTPNMTRPPAWSERTDVQAITEATQYKAVIRNRLNLTPNHPRDSIWVGVSAADNQDYIPDQLTSGKPRPGNESAIVPVICEERYHGNPVFDVPPTTHSVGLIVAPEPAGRPVFFRLDLSRYLDNRFAKDDLILPERAPADDIFAAYYVTADNRIMAKVIDKQDSSETDLELTGLSPSDRERITAELKSGRTGDLENRYVVFLAGSHPYRHRLFEPSVQQPIPLGPFHETLPAKSGRYVYFVRKSDAAGHLSAGGAMATVVVRVPSMAPGGAPEREQTIVSDPAGTLRLKVPPDPELKYVLAFSQPAKSGIKSLGESALLRTPNSPDLYPGKGIFLRAPDGILLAPVVKNLSESDVTVGPDGFRHMALKFSAGDGERIRIWACTLTRDGIPSMLAGPWSLAMPLAPLPQPVLMINKRKPALEFRWSWRSSPGYSVALERSSDGITWERVSPLLSETVRSYTYTPSAGNWKYRLWVVSPDGRTTYSDTVGKI